MLIALPTAADLRQVSRWHDQQVVLKSRRAASLKKSGRRPKLLEEWLRDVQRHQRIANQLRQKANNMEK